MADKSVEIQAREYVYDVKNCASEFGQSTLEGWEFSLVSDAEKTKIQKNYYPTIVAHPAQEALLELFRVVKSKLTIPLHNTEINGDIKSVTHLIAFNPKYHR
jgi:hypothetical protein